MLCWLPLTLPAENAFRTSPEQAFQLLSEGDFEQAIISYETMLTTENNNPFLHFNLGIAYYHAFRYSSAQQSFERALQLKMDDPQFQTKAEYNIGVTLFAQAKLYVEIDLDRTLDYLNDAISAFENAIELQPEYESAIANYKACVELREILTQPKETSDDGAEETPSEDANNPSQKQESKTSEETTGNDSGQKPLEPGDPQKPGNPQSSPANNNNKSSDKVPGAPGPQRLDKQEALLLLDSIENDEKRITLSKLQEPAEKANSESEADW